MAVVAGGVILLESRLTGSRNATRVRIKSPGGSAFDGLTGVVVRVWPGPDTVMVRIGATVLPFALSEVRVLDD